MAGNERRLGLKKRVHEVLDAATDGDKLSFCVDVFIISLILLNILALVLDSVNSMHESASKFFYWFEVFSVAMFSIEYLLRVWSCTADSQWTGALRGRVRYIFTPMALVDLLSVLPFYIPLLGIDLRVMRAFRLFRILRLVKVGRYSSAMQMIVRVLKNKRGELTATMMLVSVLLLVSSSLLYYAERNAQPEVFSSIPAAMWWAIATITTVGYGDMYPITGMGRVLGSVSAIAGIAMFALPTAILGAGFVEEFERALQRERVCPHCSKRIDEEEN